MTGIIITHANDLAGIDTETNLPAGAVSPEIFATARLEAVDLIVMCSHGETGLRRWIFSSIAQEAVRHSPVPVLVLNEHGVLLPKSNTAHPLRALVALDGSALSEAALKPAAQLLAAWTTAGVQGDRNAAKDILGLAHRNQVVATILSRPKHHISLMEGFSCVRYNRPAYLWRV